MTVMSTVEEEKKKIGKCFSADRIIVATTSITIVFRTVWLLCNLSFDGKMCLHDEKNASFV